MIANRRLLAALLAGGLLLRVLIVLASGAHASPRLWEFDPVAKNIVAGVGYVYPAAGVEYRGLGFPLYMYLTAGVYFVFGAHRYAVMLLLQSVFTLALGLVAYDLGRSFSARVGFWSAALVLAHPGLLYYETQTLHSLSLTALLVGGSAWCFARLCQAATPARSVACGAVVGLAMLAHPTVGLFALVGWLAVRHYATLSVRGAAARVAAFSLAAIVVVSPWIARNYALFGEVVLSTASGESLWRGNNPHATGTSRAESGGPVLGAAPDEFQQRVRGLSEIERNRFFREEAWRFITEHPGRALELFGKKLFAFWWFSPQSGQHYPRLYLNLYKVYYGLVLVLSLAGLAGLLVSGSPARARAVAVILISALVTLSAAQSFFYVEGRHRWSVEPLLLVLTAVGLRSAAGWSARRA